MSFQTGLSGLNAASQNLDVIGNNIANANTVGMKQSRAEFSDLVATSIAAGGGSSLTPGIGVAVADIAQNFSQGTVSVTGNNLDLAIDGSGLFQVTKSDGTTAYTRNGQFKLDKSGNIVTNTGDNLMGFPTDATGKATSITPQKLTLPTGAPVAANATASITAEFNLDASAPVAASLATPTPRSTYGTSLTTFDSQGNSLPLNLYFTRIAPGSVSGIAAAPPATDQWAVYNNLDTTTTTYQPIGFMTFNSAGALSQVYANSTPASATPTATATTLFGQLPITITNPNVTAGDISPTLDLTKATQYGTSFSVSNLTQDGYTSGSFTGLSIDPTGVITTTYSNGQTLKTGGMVALANFRNVQGLEPVGGGEYLQTFKSGAPVLGNPAVGQFGRLQSGAVEDSNVDLTTELVNMMTAQRDYQANAQTIKTQDQVLSTLVNLR
jgi:flagellar hook protein FlgE